MCLRFPTGNCGSACRVTQTHTQPASFSNDLPGPRASPSYAVATVGHVRPLTPPSLPLPVFLGFCFILFFSVSSARPDERTSLAATLCALEELGVQPGSPESGPAG